jgi:hypothetical protein
LQEGSLPALSASVLSGRSRASRQRGAQLLLAAKATAWTGKSNQVSFYQGFEYHQRSPIESNIVNNLSLTFSNIINNITNIFFLNADSRAGGQARHVSRPKVFYSRDCFCGDNAEAADRRTGDSNPGNAEG